VEKRRYKLQIPSVSSSPRREERALTISEEWGKKALHVERLNGLYDPGKASISFRTTWRGERPSWAYLKR